MTFNPDTHPDKPKNLLFIGCNVTAELRCRFLVACEKHHQTQSDMLRMMIEHCLGEMEADLDGSKSN